MYTFKGSSICTFTGRAIALNWALALAAELALLSVLANLYSFLCDGQDADRQAVLFANRSC